MSFNLRQTAVAVLLTSAFVGGASLAISACSSSTEGSTPAEDAGTEAATPKPRPDAAVDEDAGTKKTPQQCYQDCLAAHPEAKAQYEAVDKCWADKCEGPCLQQSGTFDAGAPVDAGDAGDDGGDASVDAGVDAGGLCGTSIGSGGDMACDKCTETFCCSEWGACYGDKKCSPIDECLGDCL